MNDAVPDQVVGHPQEVDLILLFHSRKVAAVEGKFHGFAFRLSVAGIEGNCLADVLCGQGLLGFSRDLPGVAVDTPVGAAPVQEKDGDDHNGAVILNACMD
jgi:hypothetical protein